MDPTEKGVWWKDDKQWVRYPTEIAKKIERAKRNGDSSIMVGLLISSCYPLGANYAIDLLTMKQRNLTMGFSRDIKIIPASSAQEHEDSEEDIDNYVPPILRRMGKDENKKEEVGKDVVHMVPSITVDLQKLSTNYITDGQCSLVLKLPKTVVLLELRSAAGTGPDNVLDTRIYRKTRLKEYKEHLIQRYGKNDADAIWVKEPKLKMMGIDPTIINLRVD